jgi:hypothetical protein
MRYLMLINHSEAYRDQTVPQGLMDGMEKFVGEKLKSGEVVDTAGLLPTSQAVRVRLSKGKVNVTDGPFTEAKEVVGGYAMIEAKSKKEAVDLAKQFMELHRIHWPEFEAACDVRPLEVFDQA